MDKARDAHLKRPALGARLPPSGPGDTGGAGGGVAAAPDAAAVRRAVVAVTLVVLAAVLARTAWISDDAAITLRTVLNLVHGFGAGFNVDERVQAYTHPLWFLLLAVLAPVLGNVFAAALAAGAALSLAAAALLAGRIASGPATAALAGAALVLSGAHVDFATSGLENPLSHVLLLLLLLAARRATAGEGEEGARVGERAGGAGAILPWVFLLAAALVLTRPDHALLAGPLALLVAFANRRRGLRLAGAVLPGALVLLAWAAFATAYYGTPLPNTAYAKLGGAPPPLERWAQGGLYLLESFVRDPVTLATVAAGSVLGWRHGGPAGRAAAVGIGLHLLWLASIGGDFMTGRMLTPAFVLALALAVSVPYDRVRLAAGAAGLVLLALPGLDTRHDPVPPPEPRRDRMGGVADERAVYAGATGLFGAPAGAFAVPPWRIGERSVRVTCGGLGLDGIRGGPGLHLVDYCALADPLLARLPARFDPGWRAGHAIRDVPPGYVESVSTGLNLVADPATAALYDVLRAATRGPLLAPGRLKAVWRTATGDLPAVDEDLYRFAPLEVTPEALAAPVAYGPWDAPGTVRFRRALDVVLPEPAVLAGLVVALDGNDTYEVAVRSAGEWRRVERIGPTFPVGREGPTTLLARPGMAGGMIPHRIDVDAEAPVDRLRILAVGGDGLYAAGGLGLLRSGTATEPPETVSGAPASGGG